MKNNNWPLIIGIALPLVFIAIVSVIVFIPSLTIKPQHNFLYSTQGEYYNYGQSYRNMYVVENGHITTAPTTLPAGFTKGDQPVYKGDFPPLYTYDVIANTSHQTTLAEAKTLNLDPGPASPDGYTITYQYGNSGIFELFGSNSNNSGYVVTKGNGQKPLPGLVKGMYGGPGEFSFIGWIK